MDSQPRYDRATVALCSAALAATLSLATPDAHAQRRQVAPRPDVPSPVALSVEPVSGTLRWRFALVNRGSAPVDVAADRNMLSVEITPPTPEAAPGRRRPRTPKPARCRGALFHSSTEDTARAQIAAGGRYSEGFDLRSLCGVRLPRALVPGATLAFTYGARARRASWSRAVVFVEGPLPIEELRAEPFTLTGASGAFPPPAPGAEPRGPVRVRVGGDVSGDRASSVRVSASLRAAGPVPLRAFYRPGMLSIELVTPRGVRHRCSDAPRAYVGLADYLRGITLRGGPSATLSLGLLCAPSTLDEPGVYLARVVFESEVASETGRAPSFRGTAVSPWFSVLIRRGSPAHRYAPLAEEDPFTRAVGAN